MLKRNGGGAVRILMIFSAVPHETEEMVKISPMAETNRMPAGRKHCSVFQGYSYETLPFLLHEGPTTDNIATICNVIEIHYLKMSKFLKQFPVQYHTGGTNTLCKSRKRPLIGHI